MPIVSEDPEAGRYLLDRIRASRKPRTPGPHMSDTVYCLRKGWHRLHHPGLWEAGAVYGENDQDTMFFTLGAGIHQAVEAMPERTFQIPGLSFTPDELDVALLERVVGNYAITRPSIWEIKSTRKSANKTPDAFQDADLAWQSEMDSYTDQLWGYCGKLGVPTGYLANFHLVGYYSPPTPVLRVWKFEFSHHELTQGSLETDRKLAILTQTPTFGDVPIEEHYDWECQYCRLHGVLCPGGRGRSTPLAPSIRFSQVVRPGVRPAITKRR